MKMLSICVFAMLCLVHVRMVSSLITNNSCAYFDAAPQIPFNKNLYIGQWFVHQLNDWTDGRISTNNYNCTVQILTPRDDGNHDVSEIYVNPGLQPRFQIDAKIIYDQPGKGHGIYTNDDYTASYDFLETDYVTYSIAFSCDNQAEGGSDCYVFIYSRFPVVLPFTQRKIDKVLEKHHIDKTKLRTTNILYCPSDILKNGGFGLVGAVVGLVGGVVGLVVGLIRLVANLLGSILKALLG